MRIAVIKHWQVYLDFGRAGSLSLHLYWTYHRLLHMHVAVKSHALHVYKKNRIASLLCIFETTISTYEVKFLAPLAQVFVKFLAPLAQCFNILFDFVISTQSDIKDLPTASGICSTGWRLTEQLLKGL